MLTEGWLPGGVCAHFRHVSALPTPAPTRIFYLPPVAGKNVLDRFFLLVAKSKSQEAFLAVILLTVIALSTITEGLGLSGTLGAFLAGTLLSETKYTPQVNKYMY